MEKELSAWIWADIFAIVMFAAVVLTAEFIVPRDTKPQTVASYHSKDGKTHFVAVEIPVHKR